MDEPWLSILLLIHPLDQNMLIWVAPSHLLLAPLSRLCRFSLCCCIKKHDERYGDPVRQLRGRKRMAKFDSFVGLQSAQKAGTQPWKLITNHNIKLISSQTAVVSLPVRGIFQGDFACSPFLTGAPAAPCCRAFGGDRLRSWLFTFCLWEER